MRHVQLRLQRIGALIRPVYPITGLPPGCGAPGAPRTRDAQQPTFSEAALCFHGTRKKCLQRHQQTRVLQAATSSYPGIWFSFTNTTHRWWTTEDSLLCKRYDSHIRSPAIYHLQKMKVQRPNPSNSWHVSLLTMCQDPRPVLPIQNPMKLRSHFVLWKDFLFFPFPL